MPYAREKNIAWHKRVAWGLLALFGLAIIYSLDPASNPLFPPCPFYFLTEMYCAGCGSLRALNSALHGDVARAFDFNPLMILLLPFVVSAIALEFFFGSRMRIPIVSGKHTGHALLAVTVLYWVVRNLPFEPFRALAP